MTASRFAATYAALTAAHEVADHWVQVDDQAVHKGAASRDGVIACAEHVITYTATQALALAAVQRVTGMRLSWRRAALGLAAVVKIVPGIVVVPFARARRSREGAAIAAAGAVALGILGSFARGDRAAAWYGSCDDAVEVLPCEP